MIKDKSRIQIILPEKVKLIIDTLNNAGFEAYAVGGCVRDCILGRKPKDWDITTSAKPLEVKSLFRRTVDTGIKHGTVTIMFGDEGYEVTTYRIESEYEDMRHPKEVIFTDRLVEDLKRRDFTINAMAYSDATGLVDEFDGLECIDKKIIRAVGNAHDRLNEDALRILRALRFSAELDYKMDEELRAAIKDLAQNLSKISAERVAMELTKLLVSDHPDKLREAYELGVTKVILPEFDLCMKTEQNTPHHKYTVGEHTIQALININEFRDEFTDNENRILKLSLLFHDFGKPSCKTTENGRDHFKKHPEVSSEMAVSIMRRLKLDNDSIDNVKSLIRWHDYRPDLTMPTVRRIAMLVGVDRMHMEIRLRTADVLAQSEYKRDEKIDYLNDLEKKYNKIVGDGDCLSIKELKVSGKDLISLGIKPGPDLGEILNALLDECIENPEKNDYSFLMQRVEELKQTVKNIE